MSQDAIDANTVVSHEQDGRVLSGVGTTVEALAEVMDSLPEPAAEPVSPKEPKSAEPQQLKKGRERYSELTRQRDEATKVAEAAEARAKDLEAKLAAQPHSPAPAPVAAVPTPAPVVSASEPKVETRPKPKEDEVGSKYPTYADFVEDLSDWKAEQRIAGLDLDGRVRGAIEQTQKAQTIQQKIQQNEDRGRKAYVDFDTVKASGPGAAVMIPTDRVMAVVEHPQSEHLQYALMKDAVLAQRLATCHQFEVGALLASIAPAAAAPVMTAPVVAPPAPYTPVGTGSKTTPKRSSDLAVGFDYDASGFREQFQAETGMRRKH